MNRILFSLSFLLLLTLNACSQNKRKPAAAGQHPTYEVLAPEEFQNRMKAEPGILIDVRTPQETSKGMIPGARALNLFDDNFDAELNKLDKSKTYYVYCGVGGRSSEASEIMQKKGFKHVVDLEGGIRRWSSQGLPVK